MPTPFRPRRAPRPAPQRHDERTTAAMAACAALDLAFWAHAPFPRSAWAADPESGRYFLVNYRRRVVTAKDPDDIGSGPVRVAHT